MRARRAGRLSQRGWLSRPARRLLLSLLLGLSLPAVAADRAAKEAELANLRQAIKLLQGEIQQVRGRYDSLRNKLRDTERRIGKVSRRLKELKQELAAKRSRLLELNAQRREKRQELHAQRDRLAGQIRASYAMGRQQYLKILLNQQDPASVGRAATYYDYLNRARTGRITDLKQLLEEIDRLESAIKDETRQLERLRDDHAGRKRELERSRGQRATLVAALEKELSSKDQRLTRLRKDEQELAALIEALAEALADIPAEPGSRKPFPKLRGKLPWPTKGPLLVRYGQQRQLQGMNWQGVMIRARRGQEVRAVSHGRVAFADWLRGYGLLMIIDHGDGYMSLYGHNESLYKETGDWVEAGEVIGAVGDSGGQKQAALYFEIRKEGKPTNPSRWCRS